MALLADKGIIPNDIPLNEKCKCIGGNKNIPEYVRRSFHIIINIC